MKNTLSGKALWLMAVTACMVVANNYYVQPLLGDIGREFAITEDEANKVATITILGYAVGLFLLVPLGDMFKKKRLIIADFALIIISLLCFAVSPNIEVMLFSGFLIGISSVVPQMMVPLVAQLSLPELRSKNIGIVMTGLLTGILGSRVLSGYLGSLYGWRFVFFTAASVMGVLWVLLILLLPDVNPTFKGSYKALLKSIITIARQRSDLRIAAIKGALSLASFQALWTTLTFHVEQPPFLAGSDVAGLLGIVGIGGALSASFVGSIVDKSNKNKLYMASIFMMLLAWILFGTIGFTYVGLILGIFILDIGLQSIHITNQSIIFSSDTHATNRINTVYMTCYFLGGTLGAYIGGKLWGLYGWYGVVSSGLFFVILLLLAQMKSPVKSR